MRKWHTAVCCILAWMMPTPTVNFRTLEMGLIPSKFEPTPKIVTQEMSAAKVIPNSVSKFFGQTKEKVDLGTTTVSVKTVDDAQFFKENTKVKTPRKSYERPVKHAGVPQNLTVSFLYLKGSDHQLQFNVSWRPSLGRPAKEYSVEILSEKNTTYCKLLLCHVFPIPGNATWVLIPESASPIDDADCGLRPGCSYTVNVNSHPWDSNIITRRFDLEECVVGVCSCEHQKYLPIPNVTTSIVMSKEGDMFSYITWTLPKPREPQRLPPARLRKLSYIVSIKKQFAQTPFYTLINQSRVEFNGSVLEGDITRWLVLPLSERKASPGGVSTPKLPTTKILAQVQVLDDRGCIGKYAGNASAFEPGKPTQKTKNKFTFGVYAILGALIGAWAMSAVFVLSKRIVKRVLKSFRPAPVSAPREPLRRRPAWFPLQLRTPTRRATPPLYVETPLWQDSFPESLYE